MRVENAHYTSPPIHLSACAIECLSKHQKQVQSETEYFNASISKSKAQSSTTHHILTMLFSLIDLFYALPFFVTFLD